MLNVQSNGCAHLSRKIEAVVVYVRYDDMPGAGVTSDRDRHDADRSGARNEHILTDEVERQRRMCRVAERIEYRSHVIGNDVR